VQEEVPACCVVTYKFSHSRIIIQIYLMNVRKLPKEVHRAIRSFSFHLVSS
jgi:hypothetical protein